MSNDISRSLTHFTQYTSFSVANIKFRLWSFTLLCLLGPTPTCGPGGRGWAAWSTEATGAHEGKAAGVRGEGIDMHTQLYLKGITRGSNLDAHQQMNG